MSLKAFHIFFIAVSALLFFGFGAWLLLIGGNGMSPWNLIGSVSSVLLGTLLIRYGARFLKKFKHVSFM